MEENKNFWNKTQEEMTVSDTLVLVALVPVVSAGALVAVMGVWSKLSDIAENRRSKKAQELDPVETDLEEE